MCIIYTLLLQKLAAEKEELLVKKEDAKNSELTANYSNLY